MLTPAQKSIAEILTRLYGEIHPLEAGNGLLFGGGDLRPRIDYFHDAVRALLQDPWSPRLRIERLAYDAEALRYIQSQPLAAVQPGGRISAQTLPALQNTALGQPRAGRQLRQQLSELYRQYGTLFAALFKPFADRDYQERAEECDTAVTQIAGVMQALTGTFSEARLNDLLATLEDPGLRAELYALLGGKKKNEAKQLLTQHDRKADARKQALDTAHTRYAMAQLALFEEGKDTVKQLAERGMNLAGRFVETAMAQAGQAAGRGRS